PGHAGDHRLGADRAGNARPLHGRGRERLCRQAARAQLAHRHGQGADRRPHPPEGGRSVTEPRKILVVDDEESMLLLLERFLEALPDVEVTLAGTCDDAVLKVGSGQYDLILLDLLMPGIGGLEVLKIVRTSVANRKTPVIIVSVLADS